MRKIILNLAVTLDGYIEGLNGEIDWCIMDGDANFNDFLKWHRFYFLRTNQL